MKRKSTYWSQDEVATEVGVNCGEVKIEAEDDLDWIVVSDEETSPDPSFKRRDNGCGSYGIPRKVRFVQGK